MSAASGNGLCGKLAATWRRVPRAALSMHKRQAEAVALELADA
jgi:hypothetical protein